MIRISQLKLPVSASDKDLEQAIRHELHIGPDWPLTYRIERRSLDARRAHAFVYVYTVSAFPAQEEKVFSRVSRRHPGWKRIEKEPGYIPPVCSGRPAFRPVVVGFGPAGMFCALLLSRAGLSPIVLERGACVEERRLDTEKFFTRQILDPDSNIQFGEGGAGTFSDGKVNTLVKDPSRRGRFVLEEFVKAGAPGTILYDQKPHIGTDRLQEVVRNMREEMIALGADIRFHARAARLEKGPDGHLAGVMVISTEAASAPAEEEFLRTDTVFLGIGHSSRDTFEELQKEKILMEQKPFAVGVRIEHPRSMIDRDQYREYAGNPALGAASYKLTHNCANKHGVYTFCMCPGGTVVAASSEPGMVVTNGMSTYARDAANSNSALIVTVSADDYRSYEKPDMPGDIMAGVRFQRDLERKAYVLGGSTYAAPIQLAGDFLSHTDRQSPLGEIRPTYPAGTRRADLHELFPSFIQESLEEGLKSFGARIRGFDRPDAVLTAVESRSSSPVRILRNEQFEASLPGLYPIGEGAGYAGGIMSAAMDGMKAAEAYLEKLSAS